MRFTKFWQNTLVVLVILLVLAGVGLEIGARVYRQEAATFLRATFSENSDLVLKPFETSVSAWKHFPRVTFTFNNISITDTSAGPALEVLAIKRIQLFVPLGQFRLSRLNLKRVELEGLLYQERVDSQGTKTGFRFRPKPTTDTAAKSGFGLNIPEVIIRDVQIITQNDYKKTGLSVRIQEGLLSAEMADKKLNLSGTLQGAIGYIRNDKQDLLRNEPFAGTANYTYLVEEKKGILSKTVGEMNKNKVQIAGWHSKLENGQGTTLNFTITGHQPLLDIFQQVIPAPAQSFLSRVRTTDLMHFVYHITGQSGPKLRPRNQIKFTLTNGTLNLPAAKRTIKGVTLHGEMDNGPRQNPESSSLVINRFSANSGPDRIELQLRIKNFIHPDFYIKGSGHIELTDLAGLVNLPFAQVKAGFIRGNFEARGVIPDSLHQISATWNGNGAVELRKANFRPAGLSVFCENVNGKVSFDKNMMQLQNLGGTLGGKLFRVDASIKNYFAYLLNLADPVEATASVSADYLDLAWLGDKGLPTDENKNTGLEGTPVKTAGAKSKVAGKKPTLNTGAKKQVKSPLHWDNTKAQINLKIAHINIPGGEKFRDLSVQVNQNGPAVKLTSMRFYTSGSAKATADGGFRLSNTGLTAPFLNVRLHYQFLDLQAFLQNINSFKELSEPGTTIAKAKPKTKTGNPIMIDKNYKVNLQVSAAKIKYQYLNGTNLIINANLNQHRAAITKFNLEAFGGYLHANGSLIIDAPGNVYPVTLRTQLHDISLPQVFKTAENMKLDLLSSNQVKGTADCNLTVQMQLDQTFAPAFDRTVAYVKATFRNMEFIGVTPIQTALKFMKKDRTEHLYFKDASTQFILKNNQFINPGLSLYSNLTSFNLSGTYIMGGAANLNIDVNAFNVLMGNNKRRIEKIQEDSTGTKENKHGQHLLLVREGEKYKVKLSNRKQQEMRAKAFKSAFHTLVQQHKIDTVFAMH